MGSPPQKAVGKQGEDGGAVRKREGEKWRRRWAAEAMPSSADR